MCYDALVGGTTERPIGDLLSEETPDALGNGAMAALVVAGVLFAGGAGAARIGWMAAAAVVLGAVIHQAVLVAGIGIGRLRARLDGSPDGRSTENPKNESGTGGEPVG